MAKPPHGGVDDPAGIFRSLTCEVEIDHGGLKGGMSHIPLDDSGVDTSLEKMSGIAVPESVDRDPPLGDAGGDLGFSEGSLGAVESHGTLGGRSFVSPSSQGREDEDEISVSHPVAAKQLVGLLRQGHVAVLGSLPPVHMDHHALAVDISRPEGQGLQRS